MGKLLSSLTSSQALVLAVTIVGCATAAVITGHITDGDWVGIVGGTGVVGGTVVTAHVVGNQVGGALATPPPGSLTAPTVNPAPTGGNQVAAPALAAQPAPAPTQPGPAT